MRLIIESVCWFYSTTAFGLPTGVGGREKIKIVVIFHLILCSWNMSMTLQGGPGLFEVPVSKYIIYQTFIAEMVKVWALNFL